ncbi:MAG: NAD-dependent epimerase/dehydratase family protein [Actinomycetota bacterium]|nr:NAD-dependent epimerase/dehydratase family protein [Actinomycetota bacterium]
MRIFVTGGTGFIGSRVVRALRERGHDVRCLLRPASSTERIDDLDFERVEGDVLDRSSFEDALRGCDGCIHLASVSGWEEIASAHVEAIVIDGTRNVVEAVQRAGGVRLVYVSSSTAINGSDRPEIFDETASFLLDGSGLRYAIAKHKAEKLVLGATGEGFEATVVNPGETYGANDYQWVTAGAIRDVLRNWPALALRGGASVTHVDDVATGIVSALERSRSGERYILGGENLTIEQIVRTVLELAGSKKPVVVLPAGLVKVAVNACRALHLPAPIPPDLVGYAARYWFMSSEKAERELGYRHRPAKDTLASVVGWIRETQAAPHG